jgi:hypothetical protein
MEKTITYRAIQKDGYVRITFDDGTREREHTYLARLYKDDYFEGCVVHHIDRNRSNNSLDNLMCLTLKEHGELHMREDLDDERRRAISEGTINGVKNARKNETEEDKRRRSNNYSNAARNRIAAQVEDGYKWYTNGQINKWTNENPGDNWYLGKFLGTQYHCEFCDELFTNEVKKNKHMRNLHKEEYDLKYNTFYCKYCNKKIKRKSNIIQHERACAQTD